MTNRILLALMAATLVGGCGGGGGSSPAPEPPPVNSPAPDPADDPVDDGASDIIAFGTISRFGSVVVNGAVFDTDGASVTINDSPAVISDLRVGQVVSVAATDGSATGVAQEIAAQDIIAGPVASISSATDSFDVLGYTVFVDELTMFENLDFEDLTVGNVVRVYGYQRSPRRVQATHIERTANAYAAGMRQSIKGEIESFDSDLLRFRVGTQLNDYSSAELDLGSANLADGLYVEVTSSSPIDGGIMRLDRVRARDRNGDRLRDRACSSGCDSDVEGFITEFVSPTEFYVDGAPITTTGSTVYVNGTEASLAREVPVAISGTLSGSGVTVADQVTFPLSSNIQIEANVDAIDTENGSLSVLGIDVRMEGITLFRDLSDAGVVEFWLDDLAIGDRAAVRGYPLADTITATRLERDNAADKVTLQAPVDTTTQPSLTMLGVSVTVDGNTEYRDADGQVVDANTFFGLVEARSVVKAVGDFNGAAITAGTLRLRDCQNSCL